MYSDVNRNGDTTSGNGTTPTVIYSETTESRVWYCHTNVWKIVSVIRVCVCVCVCVCVLQRTVRVSQDTHGVATSHQVTTVDATQYATAGHRDTTSPPRVVSEHTAIYAHLILQIA